MTNQQVYETKPQDNDGEVKLSPAEEKARSNGWLPENEYEGDDWVSAEVFNVRADFIGQSRKLQKSNESLRSDLNATKKQLEEVTSLHERMLEKEIEKQKKSLKKEKVEAQESGDYKRASEIDEELEEVEKIETTSSSTQTKNPKEVPQEVKEWYDAHGESMTTNTDFREAADSFALLYARQAGENYDSAEAVDFVDNRLKKLFPEEYGSTKRKPSPNSVENDDMDGSGETKRNKSTKGKYRLADLNEYEKQVCKRMGESLGISAVQYANDYLAKDGILEIQQKG